MEAYPTYQPVHRVPLLVLAELGPAGLLLWLAPGRRAVACGLTSRGRWPGRDVPLPVATAVVAALTGLTVISWFDFYPWFSQQGRMITWVLWGLLAESVDARRPTGAVGRVT